MAPINCAVGASICRMDTSGGEWNTECKGKSSGNSKLTKGLCHLPLHLYFTSQIWRI